MKHRGTRWRSWLRHCATSLKVAGSISDGVIGIFHWHNPSGRTVALELTQPLTEMSTSNISWEAKEADAQGWQPYHVRVPIVLKSGSLNLLEPSGPVQACNGIVYHLKHVTNVNQNQNKYNNSNNSNYTVNRNAKSSTPMAEEGYCHETTYSGPTTHSPNHQALNP